VKKTILTTTILGLSAMLLLNGCAVSLGSDNNGSRAATVGQQLIDLKKAKDGGAMSEEEYQAQKQKLLNGK
jgi:hypothetical protein